MRTYLWKRKAKEKADFTASLNPIQKHYEIILFREQDFYLVYSMVSTITIFLLYLTAGATFSFTIPFTLHSDIIS